MNLFKKPLYINYNCRLLSEATIFLIIITIIRFILPLIIVWNSSDNSTSFWSKESTFREMPDIDFKKQFLLLLNVRNIYDNKGVKIIAYSTINKINNNDDIIKIIDDDNNNNISFIPINIAQYEYDHDNDFYYDGLKLLIDIPLDLNQYNIVGLRLITLYQYCLSKNIELQMESLSDMNIFNLNQNQNVQLIRIVGHLEFVQKKPFDFRLNRYEYRYNKSIFSSIDENLENILQKYSHRLYYTRLNIDYQYWQSSSSYRQLNSNENMDQPLRLDITINYNEQLYMYLNGFWYLMKWAMIQYLAVFIIIDYFIHWIKCYVFDGYLVASVPQINDVHLLNLIMIKKQF